MRPAVIHQRVQIQFVGFGHDEQAWHFAERGVPDADHRAIRHMRDAECTTSSISAGAMFWPPRMISSLMRPVIVR